MEYTYYAGYSYMGVEYAYDSPCWCIHAFRSRKERDRWVTEHEYRDGNRVAEAVSYRDAARIAGRECIQHIHDWDWLRRHGYDVDSIWAYS